MITNRESGTSIDEIAEGIYRISTPVRFPDGVGCTFSSRPSDAIESAGAEGRTV